MKSLTVLGNNVTMNAYNIIGNGSPFIFLEELITF